MMSKMKHPITLKHEFIEYIPDKLEDYTVYISIQFTTAVHKCFCGCGLEVVTPLSPTDWELTFDGKTISLDPSIGNWGFPCQSHYWIRRSKVVWARKWSRKEIEAGRQFDRMKKENYYEDGNTPDAGSGMKKMESYFNKRKRK